MIFFKSIFRVFFLNVMLFFNRQLSEIKWSRIFYFILLILNVLLPVDIKLQSTKSREVWVFTYCPVRDLLPLLLLLWQLMWHGHYFKQMKFKIADESIDQLIDGNNCDNLETSFSNWPFLFYMIVKSLSVSNKTVSTPSVVETWINFVIN